MADDVIYSVALMREHARDLLEEWLSGYTHPLDDGMQRRVEITAVDSDWIHVRVTRQNVHGGYDRRDKHYKIAVEVKEVTDASVDSG